MINAEIPQLDDERDALIIRAEGVDGHSCPPACELKETVLVWKHWTGERLDGRRNWDVGREHENGAWVTVAQCEDFL